MTILQSIILGIVEGFTEFLPISSTAHLIITSSLLQIPSSDFLKSFEISIQLGAMLSVAALYFKRIFSSWKIIRNVAAGFIPTGLIGFAMYSLVKGHLMESLLIIAISLIVGGVVIILFESRRNQKRIGSEDGTKLEDMTIKQSAITGACQAIAVIPGVSRSAATIIAGLSLGVSRKAIVEYSFLLALPTIFAATAYDLYKTPLALDQQELVIWLIGFVASFLTALSGIKFFLKFIQKNDFIPFGWYRIILGGLIIVGLYLF